MLTFLPYNGINGISRNRACDLESFSGHNLSFLHRLNVRKTMNVQSGNMRRASNLGYSGTFVQTSVITVNVSNVQVGNDFSGSSCVLTDSHPINIKDNIELNLSFDTINRLYLTSVQIYYLSPFVTFLESTSQTISGDGFPVALHLSETVGPGCKTSSRNLKVSRGGSTKIKKRFIQFAFNYR